MLTNMTKQALPKGALFLQNNWRQQLCSCDSCKVTTLIFGLVTMFAAVPTIWPLKPMVELNPNPPHGHCDIQGTTPWITTSLGFPSHPFTNYLEGRMNTWMDCMLTAQARNQT